MSLRLPGLAMAAMAGGLLAYLAYPADEPRVLKIAERSPATQSVGDLQSARQGTAPPSAGVEQFGSWTVDCRTDNARAQTCHMAQKMALVDENRSADRFITISLRSNAGTGDLEGFVMVPLGFDLRAGAAFKLNDINSIRADIRTCVPQGCLLTFTLPDRVLEPLGGLQTLALVLRELDAVSAIAIEISTTGFMQARGRLISGGS